MNSIDPYPVIGDRWFGEHEDISKGHEPALSRLSRRWERECQKPGVVDWAMELVFPARSADNRFYGLVLEIEFDDNYEPPAEMTKALVAIDERIEVVPTGTDFIFNGRAAVRAFIREVDISGERIETIVRAVFAIIDSKEEQAA